MKIYRPASKNLSRQLNLAASPYADLLKPLKKAARSAFESLTVEDKIITKKGYIKGIKSLNKITGLNYGFSSRNFGNMGFKLGSVNEVVGNRKKFLRALSVKIDNLVVMRPNHGVNIEVVTSADKGSGAFEPHTKIGPADGLVTFEKNVVLGLNAADCVPLVMTTANAGVLALVHAGRVGTESGVVKSAIKKLSSLGVNIAELMVGIGPAIEKSCYKLEYLQTEKPNQWLPWVTPAGSKKLSLDIERSGDGLKGFKIKAEKGKILVDIIGFNIQQLINAGVNPANIEVLPGCTLCLSKKGVLYSNFLSGQYKKSHLYPEGRFMAVAALK